MATNRKAKYLAFLLKQVKPKGAPPGIKQTKGNIIFFANVLNTPPRKPS